LKGNGLIKAVGVGIDLPGFIPRFLERIDPDFFIVAMPDTLLRKQGSTANSRPASSVASASSSGRHSSRASSPRARYRHLPRNVRCMLILLRQPAIVVLACGVLSARALHLQAREKM
jgi:hypothetical protein